MYLQSIRITEYDFNKNLAALVEKCLDKMGITSEVVYRRTYRELPSDINELNPSITISLHAGAYNQKTSGSRTSYYAGSKEGERLAKILQKGIVETLGLLDRGIRPKTSEDAGGYLLSRVDSPAVITEPFFIDNNSDLEIASRKKWVGIEGYLESPSKVPRRVFFPPPPEEAGKSTVCLWLFA